MVAGIESAVAASAASGWCSEGAVVESQHLASGGDDQEIGCGRGFAFDFRIRRHESRVGRQDLDHTHTVAEFDVFGEWIAVSRGGGQAVDGERVGGTVAGEDDGRIERAARNDCQHAVTVTDSGRFDLRQPADSFDPPVAGHHHIGVFADDIGLGIEFDDFVGRPECGAAFVGEF